MKDKIKKLNDNTIEITKTPIVIDEVNSYERGFIEEQIIKIQAQKDRDNTLRDAELAECNSILAEMDKLNIVKKVVEPLEEVIKKI